MFEFQLGKSVKDSHFIHKAFEKSVSRYFLAQLGHIIWWIKVMVRFLAFPTSLSSEHLVLLDTPGRLQIWNMTELEDNGFLVASCLILHNFLISCSSTRFLWPCWLFSTKPFDGSMIMHRYLSNFRSYETFGHFWLFIISTKRKEPPHLDSECWLP